MTNKICLIDADSKIPNLPLMKLSTYYKNKGYQVDFYQANIPYYPHRIKKNWYAPKGYDKYFCSVIFFGNYKYIKGKNIIFGGTGSKDLTKKLPEKIESCECDYSLYPNNDKSYGFLTRGCIRNCDFCIVRQKEGYIRRVNSIDDIKRHRQIVFLDNNILAYKKHGEIFKELIDREIPCQFNSGYDIRLLNKKNVKQISKLKKIPAVRPYIFAFDDWSYKPIIDKKAPLLNWTTPYTVAMYLYVHPNMPISDTINRIKYVKNKKWLPYLMRDISCWYSKRKQFYTHLAGYCNQPSIFKTHSFEQYLYRRCAKKEDAERSIKIWKENGGN